MCGIIIYKGISVPISEVWNNMLEIRHRGDSDGFGYINLTNGDFIKSILTLEELEKEEAGEKRKEKNKIKERIKEIKKGFNEKTDYLVLHNRKASNGEAKIDNTHPIKISKDIFYVQNGTIDYFELLKKYMELTENLKIKGDTDTEFIGYLMEHLLKEKSEEKVFNFIDKLFVYGFGVIVKINRKTKEITIFKDSDRTLYLYDTNNGVILISEPINTITEFTKCYKLEKGIIKISNKVDITKCKTIDITAKLRMVLSKDLQSFSCDGCKSGCKNTRRMFENKDFCLVCATGTEDLKKLVDDKKDNQSSYKYMTKNSHNVWEQHESYFGM